MDDKSIEEAAFQTQRQEIVLVEQKEQNSPGEYEPVKAEKIKVNYSAEANRQISSIGRNKRYANIYNRHPSNTQLSRMQTEVFVEDRMQKGWHFSKNFESGNLHSVKLDDEGIYRLTMSFDCNSRKHSQWFYFSCRGLTKAKFKIAGFVKPDSLYNRGMLVCVNQNGSWQRGGQNIAYAKDERNEGYCLSFSFRFRFPANRTRFAYCFPYTYTDLRNKLEEIEKRRLPWLSSRLLHRTLLKNNIYCLTVTDPETNSTHKKTIVLSARVHPGQTVSSHIMQGFLETITAETEQATMLRKRFIFRIFPMLNPDGVVLGNYRLSYSGHDLNRKWRQTSSRLHPEIYHLKRYLVNINRENPIRLMIDMHGHSRKKGVFFYGCQEKPGQYSTRELPFIMSTICSSYHYENCSFVMQKSKEGTQRIAMANLLKIPYIYTLESSFCGDQPTEGCPNPKNYSIEDLNLIGLKLVQGMHIYLSKEMSEICKKQQQVTAKLEENLHERERLLQTMYSNRRLLQVGLTADSGSDSQPSEGCYKQQDICGMLKMKPEIETPKQNGYVFRNRLSEPNSRHVRQFKTQQSQESLNSFCITNCRTRIINGSIFDKDRIRRQLKRQDFMVSQQPYNYDSELIDQRLEKSAQYNRIRRYAEELERQHLVRKRPQNVSQGQGEVEATESLVPSRKHSKPDKRMQKSLKLSPQKQCRRLQIRKPLAL